MTEGALLEKARTAGRLLADAEHHAVLARADYHTAIRRVHLGGASLREIADALAISHQRVQQIVNAAGGSWWQVWKRKRLTRDTVCTWCERSPSEVSKLIAGPAVFICDECTADAERVVSGARKHRADLSAAGAGTRVRCSFCRKRADAARTVVVGPANVCGDCLRVCREILDSRTA